MLAFTIGPFNLTFSPGNIVIVGAGFSQNAGLPLASEFTDALINRKGLRTDGPSARQIAYISEFVRDVFGEGANRSPEEWPELEDVFTSVDLSANTGHHLGRSHSASDLRIVRRSIIVRMIRMLSQVYAKGQKEASLEWRRLEQFFEGFDCKTTAVLSMNWDTVFEAGIARTQKIRNVDYGCHASSCRFREDKLVRRRVRGAVLHLLKPHGSVNWFYCDACRETFWVPASQTEQVARTLFQKRDWEQIPGTKGLKPPKVLTPSCPHCDAQSLGTRFATFSYRKALDFPMHAASWRTAEEYLKNSLDWIFIGYSMPPADFEFKHLLKRVQLTESQRPRITVITGGEGADDTVRRYRKFFGEVDGERFYFQKGMDNEAIAHLQDIEVLT